jgi:hypothetical protein
MTAGALADRVHFHVSAAHHVITACYGPGVHGTEIHDATDLISSPCRQTVSVSRLSVGLEVDSQS